MDPYPKLHTDGGGTRPVVVEPLNLLLDRYWYGPSAIDYFDLYTEAGHRWLHPFPASIRPVTLSPIGSRFD